MIPRRHLLDVERATLRRQPLAREFCTVDRATKEAAEVMAAAAGLATSDWLRRLIENERRRVEYETDDGRKHG